MDSAMTALVALSVALAASVVVNALLACLGVWLVLKLHGKSLKPRVCRLEKQGRAVEALSKAQATQITNLDEGLSETMRAVFGELPAPTGNKGPMLNGRVPGPTVTQMMP